MCGRKGPSEPPPSYEEAQGMTGGPGQYPQTYPPQTYPPGKPNDVYSGNPPYPTQPGQPAPYPQQTGYAQPYAYGQPAPQGAYTPQGAYPPQGAYTQGSYVHPTVGYSPNTGATVVNPVAVPPGGNGVFSPGAERRKKMLLRFIVVFLVAIGVIIIFTIIFETTAP